MSGKISTWEGVLEHMLLEGLILKGSSGVALRGVSKSLHDAAGGVILTVKRELRAHIIRHVKTVHGVIFNKKGKVIQGQDIHVPGFEYDVPIIFQILQNGVNEDRLSTLLTLDTYKHSLIWDDAINCSPSLWHCTMTGIMKLESPASRANILQLLIDNGADPNRDFPRNEKLLMSIPERLSALHTFFCFCKETQYSNRKMGYEYLPSILSSSMEAFRPCFDVLMNAGADVNQLHPAYISGSFTAFDAAIAYLPVNILISILPDLIQAGADISQVPFASLPLKVAGSPTLDLYKAIVSLGVDVTQVDDNGGNAVVNLVRYGVRQGVEDNMLPKLVEIMIYLVGLGVDPAQATNWNETAGKLAEKRPSFAELIRKAKVPGFELEEMYFQVFMRNQRCWQIPILAANALGATDHGSMAHMLYAQQKNKI